MLLPVLDLEHLKNKYRLIVWMRVQQRIRRPLLGGLNNVMSLSQAPAGFAAFLARSNKLLKPQSYAGYKGFTQPVIFESSLKYLE